MTLQTRIAKLEQRTGGGSSVAVAMMSDEAIDAELRQLVGLGDWADLGEGEQCPDCGAIFPRGERRPCGEHTPWTEAAALLILEFVSPSD